MDCEAALLSHEAFFLHDLEDRPRRPHPEESHTQPQRRPEIPITDDHCLEVLKAAKPTIAHIPKPALASCAASLTKTLKEFNTQRDMQALIRLMAWPSYVLAVPPRGGKSKARRNVRDIVHRAELFDEVATEELLPKEAAVAQVRRTRTQTDGAGLTQRTRETIKQAIRDGALVASPALITTILMAKLSADHIAS